VDDIEVDDIEVDDIGVDDIGVILTAHVLPADVVPVVSRGPRATHSHLTRSHLTHRSSSCSTTGVTSADQTSAAAATNDPDARPDASRGPVAAGAPRQLTDQGRERKQQLVEAAMVLFAERGYAATRIADICQRAGVAKGLFYWYFPTKLDLFTELARSMRQALRRAQADAMDPSADALTRIRQGTVASVCFMADHATYFALVDVERADPAIDDALRSGSGVYLQDVRTLVEEEQRDGAIPDADPRLLALGVLGAVSSFSNAWRSGNIDLAPDDLAEFVGDWVTRALR
jgi:AcrR family transcriptional regulator